MEKFIPYEKLSKKKQRERDRERRGSWGGVNPVTRRPENPKAYNRRKARRWEYDPTERAFFFCGFPALLAGAAPSTGPAKTPMRDSRGPLPAGMFKKSFHYFGTELLDNSSEPKYNMDSSNGTCAQLWELYDKTNTAIERRMTEWSPMTNCSER